MEDSAMIQHLTSKNMESFANEDNVWQLHQLRLEDYMETELERYLQKGISHEIQN